jgi:signal transduction histidine kinase
MSADGRLDRDLFTVATAKATQLQQARDVSAELRDHGQDAVADLIDELRDDVDLLDERVKRVGLDLHDGGLQDVAALDYDLRLFRRQLSGVVEGHEHQAAVVGRVDDFLARVARLAEALREIAVSAQDPPRDRGPALLSAELKATIARYPGNGIVEWAIDDELDRTPIATAQRTALLRSVRSALTNVLQHSEASEATVTARVGPSAIEVEITDNGRGFDVDATRARSVEDQRLGLVGMEERMRRAGGSVTVTSKRGGPTRVLFVVPLRPAGAPMP